MKIFFLLLLFCFFFACSNPNEKQSFLEPKHLFGKVQSMTTRTYDAFIDNGKVMKGEEDFHREVITTYNIDGNILREALGHKAKLFEYDINGNEIKCTTYNSDGQLDYYTLSYHNKEGKIVEYAFYNADSNVIEVVQYSYNSDGTERERVFFDHNGFRNYSFKKEYDLLGNLIAMNLYDREGNMSRTYLYEQNKNKSLETIRQTGSNAVVKYTFEYDIYGNIIKKNSFFDEGSDSIFNEDGSIKIIQINPTRESTSTYKYKFDETNNWIQKTYYRDSVPIEMLEREIIYYK